MWPTKQLLVAKAFNRHYSPFILIPILQYYLILPLIYLVAVLPFSILYPLSDGLAFFLCHIIRYRRKTVMTNLAHSFPGMDKTALKKLARKYYRRMCEVLVETFKTIRLSESELRRRCVFDDDTLQLFNSLQQQQQSAFIVMGHHGNWEWVGATCSLVCRQPVFILYRPLANERQNDLLVNMRKRHGVQLIPIQNAFRAIAKAAHQTNFTIFITDQSPVPESALWVQFLQQETAVFMGVEKMAIRLNRPIVYLSVFRVKRGYYRVSAEMLVENPARHAPGDITRIHTKRLEEDIIAQPETWLWSHKRWKHRRSAAGAGQPV